MKRLFCTLSLAIAAFFVNAQNYNNVMLFYTTQKFEDAKKEVDKLMADPKAADKDETFLWKFKVYSELFADSTLKSKYPDASKEAFDALKKYSEKEPALTKLKED